MPTEFARQFASAPGRSLVIAPAGCGKTELLAQAASLSTTGKQLILTHTHAGVHVLTQRLAKYRLPAKAFRLDTIDGFALRYAASFPSLSQFGLTAVDDIPWPEVRVAAARALERRSVREVIKATYTGLYVDEYQDCSKAQHALILRLAELLPCRIVGDPMQGIYGFAKDGDGLPSWDTEVAPSSRTLFELSTPYRWQRAAPEFGEWLLTVREVLKTGRRIDFSKAPSHCTRLPPSPDALRKAPFEVAAKADESVLVLAQWEAQCNNFAKGCRGQYKSLEAVDGKHVMEYAKRLQSGAGYARALALLEFVEECTTCPSDKLPRVREWLQDGRQPPKRTLEELKPIDQAFYRIVNEAGLEPILATLRLIKTITKLPIYRPEPWGDMARALEMHLSDTGISLVEAAKKIREMSRHMGRRVGRHIVSRTVLVKGLEFDHVVILDLDQLDGPKNVYVAMTRAVKSLKIFSKAPFYSDPTLAEPPSLFPFRAS